MQNIEGRLNQCADAQGRKFIELPLLDATRRELQALAYDCGFPQYKAEQISDADLVALYATCRKRAESGPLVAQRIARKLGLSDAPSAPSSGPDMEAVQRAIEAAIAPLHDDFASAADRLHGSVTDQLELGLRSFEPQIAALVAEAIKAQTPTHLEVKLPGDDTARDMGIVHYKTGDILQALSAGHNVYIHGPAGSGKTTVAQQCAKALKLSFYFTGKLESEYLLLGFRCADGSTVRTAFREAYENGGLFLFDEFDRSSAGAVVALNAALANGLCAFPDAVVTMHPDFKCIAAGNTTLTGASRQYVAGQQFDASSVDRFAFIEFDYDEQLERALASNALWCQHVQAIRAAIRERGLNHLVTPRATLDGCKSLAAGFSWDACEAMHIYKGLDADTVDQIKRATPNPLLSAVQLRS